MGNSCKLDHATVEGKFCPQCGEKIVPAKSLCANGHEVGANAKFCGTCGESARTGEPKCANGHALKQGQKFCGICGSSSRESEATSSRENRSSNFGSAITPIIKPAQNFSREGFESAISNPIDNFANFPNSPTSNSNKKFLIAGIVSLVLLLGGISFLGSVAGSPEPVTIKVEMTLVDQTDCFDVSWGYSDIPGGQVVINVDGMTYFGTYDYFGKYTSLGCKYVAKVRNVPSDGENYSVGMASGRRGTIYKTREELVSSGWTFSLTLG